MVFHFQTNQSVPGGFDNQLHLSFKHLPLQALQIEGWLLKAISMAEVLLLKYSPAF
jgi:hypothetical protein